MISGNTNSLADMKSRNLKVFKKKRLLNVSIKQALIKKIRTLQLTF